MEERLLIEKHPVLYHMAEAGSWPSICELGLLSTRALLDHYQATDEDRTTILASCRPESISFHGTVIRDQKPMKQHLLVVLANSNLTAEEWFQFLNRRVYFWATLKRLDTLLEKYRTKRQLVIEVPTWRMVESHRHQIGLCHINIGAFRLPNVIRSFDLIQPISSFIWSSKHKVAELTVEFAVKDIAALASKVYETGGGQEEAVLYSA